MDDLKISHKDSAVVDKIIVSLKLEYGEVGEMTVHRGKKQDYLGMTLDFSKDGAFVVDMKDYLKEILKYLPEDMNGTATTPVADDLFKVRDNAFKLNKKEWNFSIVWWHNCYLLHSAVDQTSEQWFPF